MTKTNFLLFATNSLGKRLDLFSQFFLINCLNACEMH